MPAIGISAYFDRQRTLRLIFALGALGVDLWVWGGDNRTWNGGQVPAWTIVVAAVLAHACLVIWRSPLPGYLAMWLLALSGLVAPTVEGFAGFLVALFLMARTMPRPMAVLALAGSSLPILINALKVVVFVDDDLVFLALNVGLWMLLMSAVWVAGRVLARSDRRLDTERRWAEQAKAEALAVERLRLSREIHDTVAHSLTGIVLQAAGARAGLARGAASVQDLDRVLGTIQGAGEQSMRELHRLLGLLREEPGEAVDRLNGVEQIGDLIASARASGLGVVSQSSGEPVELDPSIAHTVYRVVQEGLSNVMKHAGAGARVEVVLDWLPESLAVTVRNTAGVAAASGEPAAPSGGFGLVGLRERVSVSGGTLEAGPVAQGYLLYARLPTHKGRSTTSQGDS
ncbi:MAG TPA: histidine kinase [Arachnia sp.]|mgnify:CR=1 FL=1|nr:histidine kinase [Arachnia sp.]HMT86311.1 histidine kinase [Arachnia sp.]